MAQVPRVDREPFGRTADGAQVWRYLLRNGPLTVGVVTRGAALQSVLAPDRRGTPADVVLGFADLAGYAAGGPGASYVGAVVGRHAGRIAGGRLPLAGREYPLARNQGPNNLHGGPEGFDTRVWDAAVLPAADLPAEGLVGIRLDLLSPDGDQGSPPGSRCGPATCSTPAAGCGWSWRPPTSSPPGARTRW